MPNWCEGTLKVRGTVENLIKFIQGEFINYNGCPGVQMLKDGTGFRFDDAEAIYWFRNADSYMCETNFNDVEVNDGKIERPVMLLHMKAAWKIDAGILYDICVRYSLDMKIFAIESGKQFCQDIEIVNGEVIKNDKIEYKDFEWECPFPNMGG